MTTHIPLRRIAPYRLRVATQAALSDPKAGKATERGPRQEHHHDGSKNLYRENEKEARQNTFQYVDIPKAKNQKRHVRQEERCGVAISKLQHCKGRRSNK
jgi:hypothetical protein